MTFSAFYATGTASVPAAGTTVTGTGTLWSGLVQPGDTFEAAGLSVRIAAVVDDTHLTLLYGWPGATLSASAYVAIYNAPSRSYGTYVAERATELVERARILTDGRVIYVVAGVNVDTPPSSPAPDDLYVVGTAPTGAWAGYPGYLAIATDAGTWRFTAPDHGMHVFALATDQVWSRLASSWAQTAGLAPAGTNGWSPQFGIVTDGTRRVLQVTGWTGGTGAAPTSGQYVGATGLVTPIASAIDIRGPAGADGAGVGDMTKAIYDAGNDGRIDVAAGGTGAVDAAGARTNLELQQLLTKVAAVELGGALTGDRSIYFDFHAKDGTDYEARLIRSAGTDGHLSLIQTGAGELQIQHTGTGPVRIASAGSGLVITTAVGAAATINGNAIWHTGRTQDLPTADKAVAHYVASAQDGIAAARFTYSEAAFYTPSRIASTSSVAFGTGSKTFTVAAGSTLLVAGKVVTIRSAASATSYMVGTVTSYSGTTLVVNITASVGSGSAADWTIQVAYDRYAAHISNRAWAAGSGHYAETSYALGLSNIKPDLSQEGQVGCLNLFALGGYTGTRDYVAAGYSAGDMSPLMGQAWLVGDLKSFVAWEEARTVINAGGGTPVTGSGTWAAARVQTLAGRWNGLTDFFGGKLNGVQCIAEELPNMGVAFYAHNGTAGSWTYALGTSAGASITMNGAVNAVSDPDSKEALAVMPAASKMLDVVKGTDVCSWVYKSERAHGVLATRIGVSSRNTGGIKGLSEAMTVHGFDPALAVTRHDNRAEPTARDRYGMGARPASVETVSLNAQVGILWGAVQALATQLDQRTAT
ncbi:DUF2793 domain-containing protein [Xanthobacter autotrophicus]|uniref:DUF2793 domain-containing protein n=1 Tax=Xanthobacter autotrophicus TaxID=280 RepID=UPI00372B254B